MNANEVSLQQPQAAVSSPMEKKKIDFIRLRSVTASFTIKQEEISILAGHVMLANHKLQKCYGNVQDGEFLTSNKFTFSTQRQNSSVNFNPRHATKEEVDANRLTAVKFNK